MIGWHLRRKPLSQQDDVELVTQFLGDRREEQFRELYRRHTPVIYRVCARLLTGQDCRATANPEDATQECWLRAVRGLSGFAWQSRLSTWLIGIAIRVCAELRRSSAEVLDMEEYREEIDSEEPPYSQLDLCDVDRLLARIAPGYRTVIILHDIEGLTHDEIANVLHLARGTVKSQLTRGRRALRTAAEQPRRPTGEVAS